MTAIGISTCFLLFATSILSEVWTLSIGVVQSCRCYFCNIPNETGNCLNTTACQLIDVGSSNTAATDNTVSLTASSSSSSTAPTPFYSCNDDCSTVNTTLSYCVSRGVKAVHHDNVVEAICASVVPSVVVVLILVALLAYCQRRRMEKRKKYPPPPAKMLPRVEDIDASMPTTPPIDLKGQQVNSQDQSTACGASSVELEIVTTPGFPISSLKTSQSLRQNKEDWTPLGISGSDPQSKETSKPSTLTTDKNDVKIANETQPTYTNVEPTTREGRDHIYRNVEGLANCDDDEDTCLDYVNVLSGNSAEDEGDLKYENVDVKFSAHRVTTPETSKTPVQRNSPDQRSKGISLTSSGKAVSTDWLATISQDAAAPKDSDYIDMSAKSKQKTMLPSKAKSKETNPAVMFVSAPDVRMIAKNLKPTRGPVYENQIPAVPRKTRPRTENI